MEHSNYCEKAKISVIVIVPSGQEKHISCLASIAAQTERSFETILVVKEFNSKLVELMKQHPNSRASLFIGDWNEAVQMAEGEYITTVGYRDQIDPMMLEVLYRTMIERRADMVRSAFKTISPLPGNSYGLTCLYDNETIVYPQGNKQFISDEYVNFNGKLMRKDICSVVTAGTKSKWMDVSIVPAIIALSSRVAYLTDVLYRFKEPFGGTTMTDFFHLDSSLLDIFDVCDQLEKNFRDNAIFDSFKREVRNAQILYACQRVQNAGIASIFNSNGKEIANMLTCLIERKYGDMLTNSSYRSFKTGNWFQEKSMDYIEKNVLSAAGRMMITEETAREKIKSLTMK